MRYLPLELPCLSSDTDSTPDLNGNLRELFFPHTHISVMAFRFQRESVSLSELLISRLWHAHSVQNCLLGWLVIFMQISVIVVLDLVPQNWVVGLGFLGFCVCMFVCGYVSIIKVLAFLCSFLSTLPIEGLRDKKYTWQV